MREKIFTSDFLTKLETMAVHITSSMNFGASGNRKSSAKGMSVEFSDFREYAPSDDYRRIDWNAYGRFKKLYVKLFMEEKEASIRIILDNSKSMDYGDKDIMALRLAGTFSYLALNNLDKVMVTPMHSLEENKYLGKGKNAFGHYIRYLSDLDFDGDFTRFDKIKRMNINSKGVSVIISDFFMEEEIDEILKYLAYKKQQVILLHVLSEEELNPTLDGRLKLVDSESGVEKNLVLNPALLKKYKESLDSYCNNLKAKALKYGANYIMINASDPIEKVILQDLLGSFVRL